MYPDSARSIAAVIPDRPPPTTATFCFVLPSSSYGRNAGICSFIPASRTSASTSSVKRLFPVRSAPCDLITCSVCLCIFCTFSLYIAEISGALNSPPFIPGIYVPCSALPTASAAAIPDAIASGRERPIPAASPHAKTIGPVSYTHLSARQSKKSCQS